MYENKLINEEKIVTKEQLNRETDQFFYNLNESLDKVNKSEYSIAMRNTYLNKNWSSMNIASTKDRTSWNTGCDVEFLKEIGLKSVKYPEVFVICDFLICFWFYFLFYFF